MKKHLLAKATVLMGLSMLLFTSAQAASAQQPFSWIHRSQKVICDGTSNRSALCDAHVLTNSTNNKPLSTISYSQGYIPTDIHSAYALPAIPTSGSTFAWNGRTVAIVDAYDNPAAASDLLQYRLQFKLPLCPTTVTNPTVTNLVGCFFSKVNQSGQATPLPSGSTGWGAEIDLDIQMVAATCPQCKILLVEASNSSFTNLGAAENYAASAGVNAISNSYGGSEFSSENTTTYANFFNHKGIAITASAGDSGYGVEFPAASQYVTAVGGTSLNKASNTRGWSETTWSGTGSGCSSYIARPTYQTAIGTCTHREVADVAAVADPYTGVAVYDSYGSSGGYNWYVYGGTSVASPIVASVYALAGNTGGSLSSISYGEFPYSHTSSLFDVTSGSNGNCTNRRNTSNLALCTAIPGYDGPTGLGTPDGVNAF